MSITLTPEASAALSTLMEKMNPQGITDPDSYVSELVISMAVMWHGIKGHKS